MENTKTLVNGLIVKQNPSRPDFVIGSLSFKIEEFSKFVKEHNKNGWLNIDLLTSKAGKPYAALNTWEPNQSQMVSKLLKATKLSKETTTTCRFNLAIKGNAPPVIRGF